MAVVDRDAIVAEVLARVAAGPSTWLHGDLIGEIATLLPAGCAAAAEKLVELVDENPCRTRAPGSWHTSFLGALRGDVRPGG